MKKFKLLLLAFPLSLVCLAWTDENATLSVAKLSDDIITSPALPPYLKKLFKEATDERKQAQSLRTAEEIKELEAAIDKQLQNYQLEMAVNAAGISSEAQPDATSSFLSAERMGLKTISPVDPNMKNDALKQSAIHLSKARMEILKSDHVSAIPLEKIIGFKLDPTEPTNIYFMDSEGRVLIWNGLEENPHSVAVGTAQWKRGLELMCKGDPSTRAHPVGFFDF